MKKVLVIEDQTVLRDLVCRLLGSFPMLELVGQSGDGEEGYRMATRLQPDFIVLDLMLPNLNGIEIIQRLRADKVNSSILVFSTYLKPSIVSQALRLGVNGFIEKDAPLDELEKAIGKVSSGGTYFGSKVLSVLREIMLNPERDDTFEGLTPREREIIKLIADSCTTKDIADKLFISPKTVETHRTNIMRKLNLHDIAGITRYAISNGLIEIE